MAEITCCSSATCDGLLTVGYMEDIISQNSQNTCFSLERGGTAYNECCNAPSSSTVVNYSQAISGYYAKNRVIDNDDPNNDETGFVFVTPSRSYNGCCSQSTIGVGNTILKKSEVYFDYTKAENNDVTANEEPGICDLNYSVTETKTYTRYHKGCDGNDGQPQTISVSKTHNQNTDGVIQKIFTRNNNYTNAWTVSFSPSIKEITGLTRDCKTSISDFVRWKFPEYTVGYNFETSQLSSEIPCDGTSVTLTFSSNTECDKDFNIAVTAKSRRSELEEVDDDTIVITTTCQPLQSVTPIGEDSGRQAIIPICTVNINIGTNINGYESGTVYVSISANDGEITGTTGYTFERSLCSWYAGTVESPGCDEYWPKVNWTNPPGNDGQPKDVQQIEKNCNNSKLN